MIYSTNTIDSFVNESFNEFNGLFNSNMLNESQIKILNEMSLKDVFEKIKLFIKKIFESIKNWINSFINKGKVAELDFLEYYKENEYKIRNCIRDMRDGHIPKLDMEYYSYDEALAIGWTECSVEVAEDLFNDAKIFMSSTTIFTFKDNEDEIKKRIDDKYNSYLEDAKEYAKRITKKLRNNTDIDMDNVQYSDIEETIRLPIKNISDLDYDMVPARLTVSKYREDVKTYSNLLQQLKISKYKVLDSLDRMIKEDEFNNTEVAKYLYQKLGALINKEYEYFMKFTKFAIIIRRNERMEYLKVCKALVSHYDKHVGKIKQNADKKKYYDSKKRVHRALGLDESSIFESVSII